LTTEIVCGTLRLLLLILTTTRRLVLAVLVFLAWAPAAHAWSRPVPGPVLQPFAYDEAHPYAAGQHRGIDIGAAAGEPVSAPAAGAVSFAGSVPSSGESVTIETADGYSVTLTHLGSIAVSKGASVAEGDPVGTIGPSGTPEVDSPYVHLGIRVTSDPNGYLDPLRFLPPPPASDPTTESAPPVSQPSASGGAVATPRAAPAPAPATPTPVASASTTPATARGASVRRTRSSARFRRVRGRASRSRSSDTSARELRRPRPSQQVVPHSADGAGRVQVQPATRHQRIDAPTSPLWRPVVGAGVSAARLRLDAGHEMQPAGHGTHFRRPATAASSVLLPLACNGAAALVALAAAFAAGRGARRRRADGGPVAQVFDLSRTTAHGGRERRAA
jgi:Peptidase family M23